MRSSGVTGAGPLFREVMLAAMRHAAGSPKGDGRAPSAFPNEQGLVSVEVCALSGQLAHSDCTHRIRETFVPGTEPHSRCEMHERVRIERASGLRAGPACRNAEERVFERLRPSTRRGPRRSGDPSPLALTRRSARGRRSTSGTLPRSCSRRQGARFVVDPLAPERQEIVFEARGVASSAEIEFVLDGQSLGKRVVPHRQPWRLALGEHTLFVRAGGGESRRVRFEVRREARAAPELPNMGR